LLLCGGSGGNGTLAALQSDLELLDVAECDIARIASLELSLGLELVQGLLVGGLGLFNLSLSLQYVGSRNQRLRVSLRNFASCTLRSGLLFGAVQPEERRPLADRTACADVDLGNATIDLRDDRHGSKEQCDVLRGRMVVKNYRNQAHCQHQAARDSPPQLEPQRVKGYFLAQSLSLSISAEKIVRQNCQHGAEKKFKHGQPFLRASGAPDLLTMQLHLLASPLRASRARWQFLCFV
jgi:hypothetical protein